MPKEEHLHIRIDSKLKDKLHALAAAEYMTTTQLVIQTLLKKYPQLLDPKHDHLNQ